MTPAESIDRFNKFLLGRGFALEGSETDRTFNSLLRYKNGPVVVEVIQDRGEWNIYVGRSEAVSTCSSWMRELGDVFAVDPIGVISQVDFYVRHWEAIQTTASQPAQFARIPSRSNHVSPERLAVILAYLKKNGPGDPS